MAIRYVAVTLDSGDGKKSLGELLGVSERWTQVRIHTGGGSWKVGDSTLPGSAPGGVPIDANESITIDFSCASNPAEELYLIQHSGSPATAYILAS